MEEKKEKKLPCSHGRTLKNLKNSFSFGGILWWINVFVKTAYRNCNACNYPCTPDCLTLTSECHYFFILWKIWFFSVILSIDSPSVLPSSCPLHYYQQGREKREYSPTHSYWVFCSLGLLMLFCMAGAQLSTAYKSLCDFCMWSAPISKYQIWVALESPYLKL